MIISYLVIDQAVGVIDGLCAERPPHLGVVRADAGEHGVGPGDHVPHLPRVPLIRIVVTLNLDTQGVTQLELLLLLLDFLKTKH